MWAASDLQPHTSLSELNPSQRQLLAVQEVAREGGARAVPPSPETVSVFAQPSGVPRGGLAGFARHVAVPGCRTLHSGRVNAGGGRTSAGGRALATCRPGHGRKHRLPRRQEFSLLQRVGTLLVTLCSERGSKSCSHEGCVRTAAAAVGPERAPASRGDLHVSGRLPPRTAPVSRGGGKPPQGPESPRRARLAGGPGRPHSQLPGRPRAPLPVGRVRHSAPTSQVSLPGLVPLTFLPRVARRVCENREASRRLLPAGLRAVFKFCRVWRC